VGTHGRGTHGRGENKLLGRLRSRGEDNIRMALREMGVKLWTGFVWLMLGTSGGLL
jgi:hypothetical protein